MQALSSNVVAIPADLRIDGTQLRDSLMQLARIGAIETAGVCHLAPTDLDREARDQFVGWAKEIGRTGHVDAIGNIFARRARLRSDPPPIMSASHIDAQPTGANSAGLEVMRTLAEANLQTVAPLEVTAWTGEESSRFVPAMTGSCALTLEHAPAQCDRDGVSVRDALAAIGNAGEHRKSYAVDAYCEAHIEQRPVPEAHAGPTPMELHRDAPLVAANLIYAVDCIALAHLPHGRGTVGWVGVHTNLPNVAPGRVKFSVDLCMTDDASLTAVAHAAWHAPCTQAVSKQGNTATNSASSGAELSIASDIEQIVYFPPQSFAAQRVADVRPSAQPLGLWSIGRDQRHRPRRSPPGTCCADHPKAGRNVLLQAMLNAASKAGTLRS
jgi:beta-ureidopropionase / N-carbamoyl-L-amino-acid hydrolase